MTDFFKALKADLTDRRLLPLVVVAVVALVAAVGFVKFGGGSSSSSSTSSAASVPTVAAVSLSTSPSVANKAVAETTEGISEQSHGTTHDPFDDLPGTEKASTSTPASAPASTAVTPASTTSAATPAPSPSPSPATTTPKPVTRPKPKTVYHVAVLFGPAPAPAPAPSVPLTPYVNLKLLAPLPSAKTPLIVFRGVNASGKSAIFTLVSEANLQGNGVCIPNAVACQSIELAPGQTELLSYETSSYELQVVSIASAKATSASVSGLVHGTSKVGRSLLSDAGMLAIPDMQASSQVGVLELAGNSASAASAGAAGKPRGRAWLLSK
jgi:hypothetical protein